MVGFKPVRAPLAATLLPTVLFLGLAGCSGSHEPEALPRDVLKLDASWVPVHWLSDDVVLFKDADSLFAFDLRRLLETGRVRSGPIQVSCVDHDSGEVHFARVNNRDGGTSYLYGFYLDPKTMAIEQLPEDQSIWNGEFNCPRYLDYRAEERRMKHEKLRVTYLGDTWQTPSDYHFTFLNLIRNSQGALFVLDKGTTWDEARRLLYLARDGKVSFHPVANSRVRIEYGTAHDRATNKYLIYQKANDFAKLTGPWPLRAYLLTLDNSSIQELPIPEGPWVVEYGMLDQLKGFSCGISCYTHMRLFLVGERILISVWGRLVDAKTRGLYLLRDGSWVLLKHYEGEDPPAIVNGIDGCRLAIHQAGKTLVPDFCRTPAN